MRNLIMPWKVQLAFALGIGVVFTIMFLVALLINSNTIRAENVACTMQSVNPGIEKTTMKLDCGGVEEEIGSQALIVSYLQNPGPFTCTLYNQKNNAKCVLVKNEDQKKE